MFISKMKNQPNVPLVVPQRSILGPILYRIYVNDIDKSTMGNILSFADDTPMYI